MAKNKVKVKTPAIKISAYRVFESACESSMRYAINRYNKHREQKDCIPESAAYELVDNFMNVVTENFIFDDDYEEE